MKLVSRAGRAAVGVAVGVSVLVLSGCSSDTDGPAVATVKEQDPVSGSSAQYVNAETAAYAECLEGLGMSVSPAPPVPGLEAQEGYAEIAGVANLIVGDLLEVGPDAPIGVDGEDRDTEIRDCYADNPGAKDVLLDQDYVESPDGPLDPDLVEAGKEWAECARDAGVSVIADPSTSGPDEGFVVVPAEVTVDQMTMLAEHCTAPRVVSKDGGASLPAFFVLHKGEVGQYYAILEGPFREVAEKCTPEMTEDECLTKLDY